MKVLSAHHSAGSVLRRGDDVEVVFERHRGVQVDSAGLADGRGLLRNRRGVVVLAAVAALST